MIWRAILPAVAAAALVWVPAAEARSPSAYRINVTGSGTGPGKVNAVGGFRPTRDPSLGVAQEVFGDPSSVRQTSDTCRAGWRTIGLRIVFANFGGGDSCVNGSAQTISAFGKVWSTSRGLKIGDPTGRLRQIYPRALRKGRTYRLVGATSPYGDGRRYSVLAARTSGGRVTSFRSFIGAAGD